MSLPVVVKLSGHQIGEADFLREFAATIAHFEQPVVIVHGGGRDITKLQDQLGIEPHYVDGLRVTDETSLDLVVMALCGLVNKRIVHFLLSAGVDALGLSGVDRRVVQAVPMQHPEADMGYTGKVTHVRAEVLQSLLNQGITPVLSPVSFGEESALNINADPVAGAVATAIKAERVFFVSNVEGVIVNSKVRRSLSPQETRALIEDGTISGGMIPKVQTALSVLESEVPQAVITNLEGLQTNGGTIFSESEAGHASDE